MWDEYTGRALPNAAVRAIRTKEIGFMTELGVWEIVGRDIAAQTGKRPLGTRWIDCNKATAIMS